jgi:glucose/arabinose dehydrogenase
MNPTRWNRLAGCAALVLLGCAASTPSAAELPLDSIRLPPGFEITVFASGLPDARSMTRSAGGVIYVGTRRAGNVYAVRDQDGDGKADGAVTLASGLESPNGVAFRDGSLYVAEISRVLRFDDVDAKLKDPPEPVVVTDDYPTDRHHGWKYIAFGPDGWLYVPVGAPCNICDPENPIYASITRIRPDGSGREIYAEGIRNTVGFTWHPGTGVLWLTDNGRDNLGNDVPADELNRAPEKGLHFGYPFCHQGDVPDPQFGSGSGKGEDVCAKYTPPAQKLGPHVAALGLKFYTGDMFPAEYRGRLFIAEHGSWNRDTPIGYRVMQVRVEGGKAVSYEPFATGWLPGVDEDDAWGRPVDVLVLPDGSMLVSDDRAGAIYRITYSGG